MTAWPEPRVYVAPRTVLPPVVEGAPVEEGAWRIAPWSDLFHDIEGDVRPRPPLATRMKMLWDAEHVYIGAWLEEPHLRGQITRQHSVIFYDNDFEVFLDPDGDAHHYHEIEINTLGTLWELSLPKPYLAGGNPVDPDPTPGLRTAVRVEGRLNDPSHPGRGWAVAMAIPWSSMRKFGAKPAPVAGDEWRINFSRVEWDFEIVDGQYRTPPREQRPEHNWVWSSQGVVDMHRPQTWGRVCFAGTAETPPAPDMEWPVRAGLYDLWHRQLEWKKAHGAWADRPEKTGWTAPPSIQWAVTPPGWMASCAASRLSIDHDGRLFRA